MTWRAKLLLWICFLHTGHDFVEYALFLRLGLALQWYFIWGYSPVRATSKPHIGQIRRASSEHSRSLLPQCLHLWLRPYRCTCRESLISLVLAILVRKRRRVLVATVSCACAVAVPPVHCRNTRALMGHCSCLLLAVPRGGTLAPFLFASPSILSDTPLSSHEWAR